MNLKQKQLDFIKKYFPSKDDIHVYIRNIEDIRFFDEILASEQSFIFTPDFTRQDAEKALAENKIIIYSSHEIKPGVFVTPSKTEAMSYAGSKNIYSKTVKLQEVAWIDIYEGIYLGKNSMCCTDTAE